MTDRLRTHGVVLIDGALVLRPLTEDDWDTVAPSLNHSTRGSVFQGVGIDEWCRWLTGQAESRHS